MTRAGLRILVLGAAAGGGVPQWNSNSEACRRARAGEGLALTQSSLAVSADGERWLLLNASPDLRQQVMANPQLHPTVGQRDSPIGAVVLTNGDVDHVAGLLTLREGHSFAVYGTQRILGVLRANSIFRVLNEALVPLRAVELATPFEPLPPDGRSMGLHIQGFAVPGKAALYLEDEQDGSGLANEPGDTVGLRIVSTEQPELSFCYVPGCAGIDERVLRRIAGSSVLFFDGTLWEDDEMIRQRAGTKTGLRMGHVSMSGPEGAIARLAGANVGRKIFIHINNTNPVLLPESAERAEAERAGWEIAYDGMEIRL